MVFDGTLPVDKTGVVDPETGTIRLNARVGGPENLFDNASKLIEEQEAGLSLDSADLEGYNAGERDAKRESGTKLKWGNAKRKPTYSQEHGQKQTPAQSADRARSLDHQVGQWRSQIAA